MSLSDHSYRYILVTELEVSPRKTIATAQNLYHRFHLFFPRKDFAYHVGCS